MVAKGDYFVFGEGWLVASKGRVGQPRGRAKERDGERLRLPSNEQGKLTSNRYPFSVANSRCSPLQCVYVDGQKYQSGTNKQQYTKHHNHS